MVGSLGSLSSFSSSAAEHARFASIKELFFHQRDKKTRHAEVKAEKGKRASAPPARSAFPLLLETRGVAHDAIIFPLRLRSGS